MMNVKTDTKEKFHEIMVFEHQLTADMTAELLNLLSEPLENLPKNVILDLGAVRTLDLAVGETLAALQMTYYDAGASFVICGLNKDVEKLLDDAEILETLNVTPSMSEAWDIVQMEEIERELLGD